MRKILFAVLLIFCCGFFVSGQESPAFEGLDRVLWFYALRELTPEEYVNITQEAFDIFAKDFYFSGTGEVYWELWEKQGEPYRIPQVYCEMIADGFNITTCYANQRSTVYFVWKRKRFFEPMGGDIKIVLKDAGIPMLRLMYEMDTLNKGYFKK